MEDPSLPLPSPPPYVSSVITAFPGGVPSLDTSKINVPCGFADAFTSPPAKTGSLPFYRSLRRSRAYDIPLEVR